MSFLDVLPKRRVRGFAHDVTRYAETMGWRVYDADGFLPAPRSGAFSGLMLTRPRHPCPRVLFAVLKADRTRLTDDEREWIAQLRADGQEVWVWRPRNVETVERILR